MPDDLILLSDFNRDFGAAYDLLFTNPSGLKNVLRRSVFVIGQDGAISYRWDNPDPPRLPTADEVLNALRGSAALPSSATNG